MSKIIAVANQKGGVGKTTTTINLGVGLARKGKKVLLIDADPQGSMSISLGIDEPDSLNYTIANILVDEINEEEVNNKAIFHHEEGVDFIPANSELSSFEIQLVNIIGRETILRSYIDKIKSDYEYVIIDCMPSLGMMTVSALSCADSVLIPVQASYLPVKGLQELIKTIGKVKRQINTKLEIEGILITMVDNRTNYAKEIVSMINEAYGNNVTVFDTIIPRSIKQEEAPVSGKTIYSYAKDNKVAKAYKNIVEIIDKK